MALPRSTRIFRNGHRRHVNLVLMGAVTHALMNCKEPSNETTGDWTVAIMGMTVGGMRVVLLHSVHYLWAPLCL